MTFSDKLSKSSEQGQGTIETLGAIILVLLILIPAVLLLLQALGSLILTKWASKNSHCLAQSQAPEACESDVVHSLVKNFAFKDVHVRSSKRNGVIHSEIDGKLIREVIRGSYDLEASEYKRVQ